MRLLLVDDHQVVREGLRRLLASMADIAVTDSASAHEALGLFRELHPDIVLLDLNLQNSSGFELLKRLLAEDRAARILVFSMYADPLYVSRALELGARGYVSKSAPAAELLSAIRKVATGSQYVERELASQLVDNRAGQDGLASLTPREADIMRQLGEGKSLAKIAVTLGVTYKTVANTCTVIKSKLGAERLSDLIRLAIEMRDT